MGILVLSGNCVFAQHVLTLHEALDSMEKHYPSLQIKQSLIKAAEAYNVADDRRLAKLVDVSEGNNHHDSAEVFGNLRAGDRVVLNATDELKQGSVIQ